MWFGGRYRRPDPLKMPHRTVSLYHIHHILPPCIPKPTNLKVILRHPSSNKKTSGLEKTPYELWRGRKPDLSHVRVLGTPAMVHVSKISRTKWDKKADKYIIFGYPENTKGYRLYNPVTKNITTSRDVVIMENRRNSDMIQVAVEEKEKLFLQIIP